MSDSSSQRPLAHVRQLPDGTWDEHFLDEYLPAMDQMPLEK